MGGFEDDGMIYFLPEKWHKGILWTLLSFVGTDGPSALIFNKWGLKLLAYVIGPKYCLVHCKFLFSPWQPSQNTITFYILHLKSQSAISGLHLRARFYDWLNTSTSVVKPFIRNVANWGQSKRKSLHPFHSRIILSDRLAIFLKRSFSVFCCCLKLSIACVEMIFLIFLERLCLLYLFFVQCQPIDFISKWWLSGLQFLKYGSKD